MDTPGLNHIVLTVADVERSLAYYRDFLGFETYTFGEGEHFMFYFDSGKVSFFFQSSPRPLPDDRFSEFRIGLDHLSFTAPSKEALEDLAARLNAAGSESNGVEVFKPTGNYYIAFRDPDNIQLEYWLPKEQ